MMLERKYGLKNKKMFLWKIYFERNLPSMRQSHEIFPACAFFSGRQVWEIQENCEKRLV